MFEGEIASERATSGHGRGNLLHMCIPALHEAPKRRARDLQEPASSAGGLWLRVALEHVQLVQSQQATGTSSHVPAMAVPRLADGHRSGSRVKGDGWAAKGLVERVSLAFGAGPLETAAEPNPNQLSARPAVARQPHLHSRAGERVS